MLGGAANTCSDYEKPVEDPARNCASQRTHTAPPGNQDGAAITAENTDDHTDARRNIVQ